MNDRPTCLYRFYDAEDQLLYVGITLHLPQRWASHAHDKSWWAEVARCTVEHHPDRISAGAAELTAIAAEHPRHNIVGRRRVESSTPPKVSDREPRNSKPRFDAAFVARARAEDPIIDAIVETATILGNRDRDQPWSCACAYWYSLNPSLRDFVVALVGWCRDEGPNWLCDETAYHHVYQASYNALADCAEDCGADSGVTWPSREKDLFAAIRVVRNGYLLERRILELASYEADCKHWRKSAAVASLAAEHGMAEVWEIRI